jgi:hypothetical protein
MRATATARIMVEVGRGAITLHLHHWDLKPSATMTPQEAEAIALQLLDAVAKVSVPEPLPPTPSSGLPDWL